MTRKIFCSMLAVTAAGVFAGTAAADTGGASPAGMKSNGNGSYLDLFLSSHSAKWNVSSYKNNTGTTKPSGLDLVVNRGVIGAEYGHRAVNGLNWAASFGFEQGAFRQEVNGANVGNDIDGTGWTAAGTLAYEHDFTGARAVSTWAWGVRAGATLSFDEEKLKTSNSATPFSGTLNDTSLRPFGNIIAVIDNGNLNWEFNAGVYLDIAINREVKDTTSGNAGGNATLELTPNNMLGLTAGAAVIFGSYRISLQVDAINEVGFRAAFSFMF